MEIYKARFYENGELVLEMPEVHLQLPQQDPAWRGQMEFAQGEFVPFEMGNTYRIELDNGQAGDIIFSGLVFGSDCCTTAKFEGMSPLVEI